MLNEMLKRVAVVGAAGKMGRGISLLLLQEMATLGAESNNFKDFKLIAIDTDEESLIGLREYLKSQLIKYAEKNIVMLRYYYRDNAALVDNREIINNFVECGLGMVRDSTELAEAKNSKLIFEAIIENVDVKVKVYKILREIVPRQAYFFTNTSSIPISVIDSNCSLEGRIIGYHFYNPPPVQKLVEVIPAATTKKELVEIAFELGVRLKKNLVTSIDKAAFIGNGHFLRDVSYVLGEVDRLGLSCEEAIYCMNRISQDFMLRPMGIFQLMDYVGIDVAGFIYEIMEKYLEEKFEHRLITEMVKNGIMGGQFSDGSQKDGFLKYEGNKVVGVYSLREKRYISFEEGDWKKQCDEKLGSLPNGHFPWKVLSKDPQRREKLAIYFKNLFKEQSLGAEIAKKYLLYCKELALKLVQQNVARSIEDVNAVLMNGFYHLYGPVNEYY